MNPQRQHRLTRTVDLDHEQLLILHDEPGTRIQVLFGGLWLTEERNLNDHFASAGEWVRLERRGRAVVEARGRSRLRITLPMRRGGAWWHRAVARVQAGWATLSARTLAASMALVLSLGAAELMGRSVHDPSNAAGSGMPSPRA